MLWVSDYSLNILLHLTCRGLLGGSTAVLAPLCQEPGHPCCANHHDSSMCRLGPHAPPEHLVCDCGPGGGLLLYQHRSAISPGTHHPLLQSCFFMTRLYTVLVRLHMRAIQAQAGSNICPCMILISFPLTSIPQAAAVNVLIVMGRVSAVALQTVTYLAQVPAASSSMLDLISP